MAITYRLQKTKHNLTALSGEGASVSGGRWNAQGVPLVYTSTTISLCILEFRVQVDASLFRKLPPMSLFTIEIPDAYIHDFNQDDLPGDWGSIPAIESTQIFLASWLEPGNKLAFRVPSAVNHYESNILINPLHPDISKVIVRDIIAFRLDERLYS